MKLLDVQRGVEMEISTLTVTMFVMQVQKKAHTAFVADPPFRRRGMPGTRRQTISLVEIVLKIQRKRESKMERLAEGPQQKSKSFETLK